MSLRVSRAIPTVLFCLLSTAQFAEAMIRYVKPGATGSGNNWTDAADLQSAIAATTSGDEVWVSGGSFTPTSGSSQTISFVLKSGSKMYGGFRALAGDEGINTNTTRPLDPITGLPTIASILSGELGAAGNGDNSYHVVTANSSTSTPPTILSSFTISDGNAADPNQITGIKNGGGILLTGTTPSPTIEFCTIENNAALLSGAGIFCSSSGASPVFEGCVIRDNSSARTGGGAHLSNASQPRFTRCLFESNDSIGSSAGGGAIRCMAPASGVCTLRLNDCLFIDNITAGANIDGGGAIAFSGNQSTLIARNCLIQGNIADKSPGGGVCVSAGGSSVILNSTFKANKRIDHADGNGGAGMAITAGAGTQTLVACRFIDNDGTGNSYGGAIKAGFNSGLFGGLTAINCLFTGNTASHGAAADLQAANPVVSFINCTVAFNSTNQAVSGNEVGGIRMSGGANVSAINSILWGNSDGTNGTGTLAQIKAISGTPTITYSCVQGASPPSGAGNINADPKFVDQNADNYHLMDCSPAISAGNNSDVPLDAHDVDQSGTTSEATPDLDLADRIVNTTVDMGAYEWHAPSCATIPGDLNSDSLADGRDIRLFLVCILSTPSACPCADMYGDNTVDLNDIPCFVAKLMGVTCTFTCEGEFNRGLIDCNANGEDDANDIGWGNSPDCNINGVPDSCDIADEASDDENTNGIPDECETDCNANGHPDDVDVASQTSNDMNSNGLPDECEADCNTNNLPDDWDISEATSADCNLSGVPDECEVAHADCNSNGVPDDCDMNPEDPDGDEWVSPDCNSNNYPDECDLTMSPPFGSIDCNENGIPDECDIAAETSEDANTNGIPDECEEGQRSAPDCGRLNAQLEESSLSEPSPQPSPAEGEVAGRAAPTMTETERWASFYDWCVTADLRGLSQRERYDAIMTELDELELPRVWPPVPIAP